MGIIARAIKAASGTINFLAGSPAKSSEVNSDFNTVYSLVNGNIDNDNISNTAAIASSKLGTITSAGKVNGAALTGLASIPAGAGVIPSANLPESSLINLTTDVTGILPIANGGTGAATAQAAIDALLPAQGSATGKFLTTNGSASSWGTVSQPFTLVQTITDVGVATTAISLDPTKHYMIKLYCSFDGSGDGFSTISSSVDSYSWKANRYSSGNSVNTTVTEANTANEVVFLVGNSILGKTLEANIDLNFAPRQAYPNVAADAGILSIKSSFAGAGSLSSAATHSFYFNGTLMYGKSTGYPTNLVFTADKSVIWKGFVYTLD